MCICSLSRPYSRSYSTSIVSAGSFPGFRTGITPTPSSIAIGVANRNPRASTAAIASIPASRHGATISRTAAASAAGSARSGVMSRNKIPGLGKSGTGRMKEARSTAAWGTKRLRG